MCSYVSDEVCLCICVLLDYKPVLEITVSHWPFSDQFQHLADQNPAKFTVHFQWDGN